VVDSTAVKVQKDLVKFKQVQGIIKFKKYEFYYCTEFSSPSPICL